MSEPRGVYRSSRNKAVMTSAVPGAVPMVERGQEESSIGLEVALLANSLIELERASEVITARLAPVLGQEHVNQTAPPPTQPPAAHSQLGQALHEASVRIDNITQQLHTLMSLLEL